MGVSASYQIGPVADIAEIITGPAARWSEETETPLPVSPDAVALIQHWWNGAIELQRKVNLYEEVETEEPSSGEVAGARGLGGTTVGLLHLQAVLDAIFHHWRSAGTPPTGITAEP